MVKKFVNPAIEATDLMEIRARSANLVSNHSTTTKETAKIGRRASLYLHNQNTKLPVHHRTMTERVHGNSACVTVEKQRQDPRVQYTTVYTAQSVMLSTL